MTAPPLRVLSLSTVFPNPSEKTQGIFVYQRLREIGRHVELKVVAPVPAIDYGNPGGRWFQGWKLPRIRQEQGMEIHQVRWLYMPFGLAVNSFMLCARVAPYLHSLRRKFPFDIIDAHFGYPEGAAAYLLSKLFSVPYTITMRGNETMHAGYPARRRSLLRALRGASRVITVSDALRRFAIDSGVPAHRVVTIPNGIDGSLFYPRDRGGARGRFSLPAGRPVVLSAGYLIERKGHHRLMRALHSLKQDWPAGRGPFPMLVIAGGPGREGKFADSLKRLVDELGMSGDVHFTGALDHASLAELMSAADIFCLASSREGWPNVVHEAMACGAPVVATSVGGVPEMIPSKDYGMVVPEGEKALEEALGAALGKEWDREKIAAWGRSRSWINVAAECLTVIAECTAGGKKTGKPTAPSCEPSPLEGEGAEGG